MTQATFEDGELFDALAVFAEARSGELEEFRGAVGMRHHELLETFASRVARRARNQGDQRDVMSRIGLPPDAVAQGALPFTRGPWTAEILRHEFLLPGRPETSGDR